MIAAISANRAEQTNTGRRGKQKGPAVGPKNLLAYNFGGAALRL